MYMGLDLGGTGVKAGVFGQAGEMLGFGHETYSPNASPEGHAEIPIEEIYVAARNAARKAVAESGARIRSLSISSQGQTFVSLDKDLRPLHKAIMWYDGRAVDESAELEQAVAARVPEDRRPCINVFCAAAKVLWLRKHYPERMAAARHFFLLPDYFTRRLTGTATSDPYTAGSTGLYAEEVGAYTPEALRAAEISEQQLARVLPPATPAGAVLPEMAEEWGLEHDTLVSAGANDQYAGALGAGNCRPGIVSETTGTCLALVTLAERLPPGLPSCLIAGRFPIPKYKFVVAFSKTAGLTLDWFKREFCSGESLKSLDAAASCVQPGSNGLSVLPHFDGTICPATNPAARGAFCNLSLQHSRAHVFRAILESLAYAMREKIALLGKWGFDIETVRSIGGGAKSDLWLQIKADVIGMSIERPAVAEAAILGAAMMGAVGLGAFKSLEECSRALYRIDKEFSPKAANHKIYAAGFQNYLDLKKKLYGET